MKPLGFTVGDVVTLKSSSPKMTITELTGTGAAQMATLTYWDTHFFKFSNVSIPTAALIEELLKHKKL